jgi:hypothetical protein
LFNGTTRAAQVKQNLEDFNNCLAPQEIGREKTNKPQKTLS